MSQGRLAWNQLSPSFPKEAKNPVSPMVIELGSDHLRVTISGVSGLSLERHTIDEIMDAAAEKRSHRVLLDARSDGSEPTTMDCFYLGEYIASRRPWPFFTMAIVVREDMVNAAKFTEVVARNRGVFLQVFADDTEALGWLRSISS